MLFMIKKKRRNMIFDHKNKYDQIKIVYPFFIKKKNV